MHIWLEYVAIKWGQNLWKTVGGEASRAAIRRMCRCPGQADYVSGLLVGSWVSGHQWILFYFLPSFFEQPEGKKTTTMIFTKYFFNTVFKINLLQVQHMVLVLNPVACCTTDIAQAVIWLIVEPLLIEFI